MRDAGRRPASGPWRRRGRGGSRRASRSEAEGSPKGLARPRSASAPKGAQRAASKEGGQSWARPCSSGRRNGRVAQRLQRSRRERPTAELQEPRGHQDGYDARRGRWGKAPSGGRAVGGRGGESVDRAARLSRSLRLGQAWHRAPRLSDGEAEIHVVAGCLHLLRLASHGELSGPPGSHNKTEGIAREGPRLADPGGRRDDSPRSRG